MPTFMTTPKKQSQLRTWVVHNTRMMNLFHTLELLRGKLWPFVSR